MPAISVVIVTPEQTVLETEADFVALPLYDGEIGIAPGRAPLIGRLGFGELRIRQGGTTTAYYVDGGFVQVADNVVSVMTSQAMLPARINLDAAEKQLAEATRQSAISEEGEKIRDRRLAQARGQIRTARKPSAR
jgi:F-type H+-transporting ATPase subunit epsilon